MKNIAIFASGSGTNAENIARYFANSENVNVAVVLSNNRNVGVHGRVNKLGVPSFVFSREEFIAGVPILEKLAEYEKKMPQAYKEYTDKNEILEHLDGYYDTFKSWADEFATASHERKKMIICKLIDRIEIGKGYDITVKMNINYEQFL